MYRVIWQYGTDRMGPLDSDLVPARPLALAAGDSLFADLPLVGEAEPVFPRPPLALRADLVAMPESFRQDPLNDLAGYHHAFVEGLEEANRLRERLLNEPDVVYAEIQGRPEPPFIVDEARHKRARIAETRVEALSLHPAPTSGYEDLQVYLNAAPAGIDAKFAWLRPGGRGQDVTIVDIESGWNFGHEDLKEKQIGVIHGINTDSDHGTAVLGIYSGDHNAFGVTGIAANAIAAAASATYDFVHGKWNAEAAVMYAADRLRPGDVVLLEMHAPGPNATGQGQTGFIPVEYWQSEFAAIQYAVQRGVNVVEAGGNGGEDLDDPVYDDRFSRSNRDSGAILVGGGSSAFQADARSRIWWSNYGSRLDVQGWGEDIVTTGGRSRPTYHDLLDHADPSRCYTKSFGGTSGASPIVVGAVACITGCLRAADKPVLSPGEMRRLLTETGTPQTDGGDGAASQHIGPLPDLKAALEQLGI